MPQAVSVRREKSLLSVGFFGFVFLLYWFFTSHSTLWYIFFSSPTLSVRLLWVPLGWLEQICKYHHAFVFCVLCYVWIVCTSEKCYSTCVVAACQTFRALLLFPTALQGSRSHTEPAASNHCNWGSYLFIYFFCPAPTRHISWWQQVARTDLKSTIPHSPNKLGSSLK